MDITGYSLDLVHGLDGHGSFGVGKSKEILDLTDDNGNSDTGGKTGGDGIGNKLDETAKL